MHRLRHIDAMRGLAAIAVIYFHIADLAMKRGLVTSEFERHLFSLLTEYMDLGKIAVTVFFVVSGFVIPFSLFKFQNKALFLFGISRFFRLYPAYWVSLPFGLYFLFVLKQHAVTPLLVGANITMLQQFIGVQNVIELYWTLQIELIFYVICAVLFAAKKLDDARTVTGAALFFLGCALVLGALRYILDRKLPVALPLSLSIMFWGLCIRYYRAEDRAHWKRPLQILTGALVILIPVISLLAYNKDMGFHETWHKYTVTYYVALALFYFFYRYCRVTGPVFVYLGTISYSIYLFGPIAQEALLTLFGYGLFSLPIHVFIVMTTALTIAIAAVVYRYVEAPSVALGRRIIESYNPRSPEPALSRTLA